MYYYKILQRYVIELAKRFHVIETVRKYLNFQLNLQQQFS